MGPSRCSSAITCRESDVDSAAALGPALRGADLPTAQCEAVQPAINAVTPAAKPISGDDLSIEARIELMDYHRRGGMILKTRTADKAEMRKLRSGAQEEWATSARQ